MKKKKKGKPQNRGASKGHLEKEGKAGDPVEESKPLPEELPKEKPGKKVPARKKVHEAQLKVLDQVDQILTGNCKSAIGGNYNCAKFVLDWSGVSDIRTPLARKPGRKSPLAEMLKRLKEARQEPKAEAAAAKR